MSAAQAPLRVLVAGAGLFGQEHLIRLAARDDVKLVGVADTSSAALERARDRFGVEALRADPLALIDEVAADAIVVANPAATHVEICAHALRANLCVLLEKPVAPSGAAACALIAGNANVSGFVLPGHVLRFSRDHLHLVDIVRSGRIGSVIYVNSRRYRDDSHALRYSDTDPVLMTLIHDIDLAQWVTNSDFGTVHAHRSGGPGFRPMTSVCATTTTGVVCELRTGWTFIDGQLPPDLWEVVGDRGSVELAVGRGITLYCEGRANDYLASEADDPLRNEQDHFLACVRDRSRLPALGLPQALAGLKLADASMQSLRAERAVALKS
jgi:predicted dehydrogenase